MYVASRIARAPPERQPAGTVHVIPDAAATSSGAGAGAEGAGGVAVDPSGVGFADDAVGALAAAGRAGSIERFHATKPSTRSPTTSTAPTQRIMSRFLHPW